jgi:hypothetical protein
MRSFFTRPFCTVPNQALVSRREHQLGPGWFFHAIGSQRDGSRFGMKIHDSLAVIRVAIMVTVVELCPQLAQIGIADRLTAQRANRIYAGCPAIHQNEVHLSPRNVGKANVTIKLSLFTPA